jgi:hypothetical protein
MTNSWRRRKATPSPSFLSQNKIQEGITKV